MTGIYVAGYQQPQQKITLNKKSNPTNEPINFKSSETTTIDVATRALELGITEKEYNAICTLDPSFGAPGRTVEEQRTYIQENHPELLNPTKATVATTPTVIEESAPTTQIATTTTEEITSVEQTQAAQIAQNVVESEVKESVKDNTNNNNDTLELDRIYEYDFRAFEELDGRKKLRVIFTETARNKYLYGDKNLGRTPEDWENLSEDDKKELIRNERKAFFSEENRHFYHHQKEILEEDLTEDEMKTILSSISTSKLEKILLANTYAMSIDEYNKRPKIQQEDDFIGLFFDTKFSENTTSLTENQENRLQDNIEIQKAWYDVQIAILKKDGEEKHAEQIKEIQALKIAIEQYPYATEMECLQIEIDKFNTEFPNFKIAMSDLKEIALRNQINRGEKTSELDRKALERLEAFNRKPLKTLIAAKNIDQLLEEKKIDLLEYSLLEEAANSEIGYDPSQSDEEKYIKLEKYLDKKLTSVTSNSERVTLIANLIYELLKEDKDSNGPLIQALHEHAVRHCGKEFETELAKQLDQVLIHANVANADVFSPETGYHLATSLGLFTKENPEFGNQLTTEYINNTNGEQLTHTNDDTPSAFDVILNNENFDKSVKQATSQRTLTESHKNEEIAEKMSASIKNSNNETAKIELATNAYLAASSLQTQFLSDATYQCSAATAAAIEADVASKFATENQADAVKLLRDNVKTQFEGKDVDKYLSTLADNIHNLEVSVQQDALKHIYESGNQAAIDKALENLFDERKSINEIRDAETSNTFSLLDNIDFSDLDLKQKLSPSEIAALPPAKKQQYYIEMFKQASPSDKLKILEKIPSGTQKKTIFTIIVRFVPGLMKNMIEAGLGLQMLSSNLPMDASNKVLKAMLASENNEVKEQVETIRKDKTYAERLENMESEINSQNRIDEILSNPATASYMSTPRDLAKTLGLTPDEIKDVKTMYARYYQGGFKA